MFEFVVGFTVALGMATTAVTIIQNSLSSAKKSSKPTVNVVVVMDKADAQVNGPQPLKLGAPAPQPITVTLEKPVALLCSGKKTVTTYDKNCRSSSSSVDNHLIKTA